MSVQKDDVDSQSLAIVGLFGAIAVFVLIVGVQVLFYRFEKSDMIKKVEAVGYADLQTMQNEHRTALSGYKWVDRQKETVAIPIERAMDLVVRDLQTQKP